MDEFGRPHVVVGVDDSLSGLAALRAAVSEARRRGMPVHAVRARTTGLVGVDLGLMNTAFLTALGTYPTDIEIRQTVSVLTIEDALCRAAADPRSLIVVGCSGKGPWHALWSGSVVRGLMRRSRCPVLAVPVPEMSRSVRHAHRWRSRSQWDPWQQFEQERPEFHGRPYSGI